MRLKTLATLTLLLATCEFAIATTIPLPRPRPGLAPAAAVNSESTEPSAPSLCRQRLTADLAIAPSLPPVVGAGECAVEDVVRLEAVVLADKSRVALTPRRQCAAASPRQSPDSPWRINFSPLRSVTHVSSASSSRSSTGSRAPKILVECRAVRNRRCAWEYRELRLLRVPRSKWCRRGQALRARQGKRARRSVRKAWEWDCLGLDRSARRQEFSRRLAAGNLRPLQHRARTRLRRPTRKAYPRGHDRASEWLPHMPMGRA